MKLFSFDYNFVFLKTSLPNVLDMALTGKFVKAKKAKSMGIVDMLVEPLGPGVAQPEARTLQYLEEVAVDVARYYFKDRHLSLSGA